MTDIIDLNRREKTKTPGADRQSEILGPPDEAKKAKLIRKAALLCEEAIDPGEREIAARVIARFYEHVPPGDVAERPPRDLGGGALAMWRFARRRRPGQAKIRVYNPEPDVDGWSSPHTIVGIVNDDMPFLVDSVTAAINASERVVRLVIHPLLTVDRDPAGRLREIIESGAAGLRESWMQVEITREPDPAGLATLTQALSGVLADVRAAVADWAAMRQRLGAVRNSLRGPPAPPVPQYELAEVEDFLGWLGDDNFTFLGFREYLFNGSGESAAPGLGILADREYRIFDGLRDLPSLPPDVQDFIRRRELLVITKSNRRSTVHRPAHMDVIGIRRFNSSGEVIGIRLFLGLLTSPAYNRDPRAIPLLRRKIRHTVERSGLSPSSLTRS